MYCLYGRIAYYIVVSELLLGHGPRSKRLSMRALFCYVWHVCRVSCLLIEHTMDVVEARAAVVLIAAVSSGDVDLLSISMDASVHHDRYQFVLTAPLSQCFRTVSTCWLFLKFFNCRSLYYLQYYINIFNLRQIIVWLLNKTTGCDIDMSKNATEVSFCCSLLTLMGYLLLTLLLYLFYFTLLKYLKR